MKTLKLTGIVLLIVFGFATQAWAEKNLLTEEYDICLKQPGNGTTLGIVECTQAEQERQKIKLEAAYKELMETLPEDQRKRLEESHKAWLLYQESYSSFVYHSTEGSIKQIRTANFLMNSTAQWAEELDSVYRP